MVEFPEHASETVILPVEFLTQAGLFGFRLGFSPVKLMVCLTKGDIIRGPVLLSYCQSERVELYFGGVHAPKVAVLFA